MTIVPAGAADGPDIEALLDAAFGADRHGRTAYRLREGLKPIPALSLVLHEGGDLIGSVQCWPLALDGKPGLTLLGPVAVKPERQGEGFGIALMEACLERADAAGQRATVLIGDPEYYGRFGFVADPTGGWELPGPVERRRLLARLAPGTALPAHGKLGPALPRRLAA